MSAYTNEYSLLHAYAIHLRGGGKPGEDQKDDEMIEMLSLHFIRRFAMELQPY